MEKYKSKIIPALLALNLLATAYLLVASHQQAKAIENLGSAMASVGDAFVRSGMIDRASDGTFVVNRVITEKDLNQ